MPVVWEAALEPGAARQPRGQHAEILDEQGRPCAPGQLGRVGLTPLHNFALLLNRYAIGDYALGSPF